MARQQTGAEVNAFVKGLITEASPLTFPDNAAIDLKNVVLNRDGSITRRLGMNYETDYIDHDSKQRVGSNFAVSSYVWKSPGGYSQAEIVVIQTGNILKFFNSVGLPVSRRLTTTVTLSSSASTKMSFTSVDGLLVVAEGSGQIYCFDYNGSSVTQTSGRLLIRDLFGVADVVSGVDLLSGNNIATRPANKTDQHIYNLRNQTFSTPKKYQSGSPDAIEDPIFMMKDYHAYFPSNSDNLVSFLFADANNSTDRNVKRYFVTDNFLNPLGTNRAPVGYFIIDAMNRGASRLSAVQKLNAQYPVLRYDVTSLPTDSTPGGARIVASYSGRVFYAGFSSQLNGGDSQSPRMASYVLFSRLVKAQSDIFKCYQEGDPTSSETPDLVDTDGGFIRLDGAYNIQYMVNVGDALMVIAENGVWKVTGGSGYGFKATDYLTSKITEHGSISANSVVIVDNTFMYWSDDGIYHVAQNQYGDWEAKNLTSTTIQTLFDNIPYVAKVNCQGLYDSYQRRIRWLYFNTTSDAESAKEIVLDMNLAAFYTATVDSINGVYPRLLTMIKVPPYETVSTSGNVVDDSQNSIVTASGNNVVSAIETVDSSLSETYYVVATRAAGGTIRYSFAFYRDSSWTDWYSYNSVGIDAPAYVLTGWSGMGDFQRQKQVSYLTVYSLKTETGFDANYNPLHVSSIKVQGQWSWTNSDEAGKWTQEFQAYRHKRFWAPSNPTSAYDDGEAVVVTKNKLRGRGRVISLKFGTEPGKDFHLLGWSYLAGVNGTV